MTNWSLDDARALYNIAGWSGGYFDINNSGKLAAYPNGVNSNKEVDLHRLLDDIHAAGLSTPVLVRFQDILHNRIDHLYRVFQSAIKNSGYEAEFTAAYPIKVNQQSSVVTHISGHTKNAVGLEAGSKTELMVVLALNNTHKGLIICNGYKDREYIRLALIGKRMGHRIFIVLEKPSEFDIVVEEARDLDIEPLLGIRVRPTTVGSGKWQNSGGDKSKFGLSAAQALNLIEQIRHHNLLGCLRLLHYHLGSQVSNLQEIELGIQECGQYYAQLQKLGARFSFVDVGGGLGIDYDGTQSTNYFSMNYTIEQYANKIVGVLKGIFNVNGLAHPHIIIESGRAMTAHHTVLITNVTDAESNAVAVTDCLDTTETVKELYDLYRLSYTPSNHQEQQIERYSQAKVLLKTLQLLFTQGRLTVQAKASAEKYFRQITLDTQALLNTSLPDHNEMVDELNEKLATKYFCNFSLFQSLPDAWAIQQIFPIMPIHRLHEYPSQRCTLHDITCDSDGRIDSYVMGNGITSSLAVHPLNKQSPYYLGIFLVGAYQEILGDMHNLFGDTNTVDVSLTDSGYELRQVQHGESVDYVLRHIHFNPDDLITCYKKHLTAAGLSAQQFDQYLSELKSGLTGYTYLED